MENILKHLDFIFKEVLDNYDISLNPQTKAADIEEWDSLTNIELIVAIEKEFNIKFSSNEIGKWLCVGDMCNAIANKIN